MQRKTFFIFVAFFLLLPLFSIIPYNGSLAFITASALATDNLALEEFTLYAHKEVELEQIANSNGNVGSNRKIEIDDGVSGVIIGDLRALGRIENEGKITIKGDVLTNKKIDNDGILNVDGTIDENADLSKVDLPKFYFKASGPSYTVDENESLTLEPGSYGRIKVRKYATLNLSAGEYFFRVLDTGPHTVINIDLQGGAVTINVKYKLDIDDYVEVRPHSGVSRDLTFNCLTRGQINIQKHARVWGTIIAPRGKVKFKNGSSIQGAVYARKISMDKKTHFAFHSSQPIPPPLPPPPPTVNYRSIGTQEGVLYNIGSATVAQGSDMVTFDDDDNVSLPENIGLGDMLILAPDSDAEEIVFIRSRDDAHQLSLQSPAANDHTSVDYAILRAYTSIQDWEDDREGNLVRENRVEVGVCYNDGPFLGDGDYALATIDGSKTDAEHFMWLTVAEGQRHLGIAGTGVVLDGENTSKIGIRPRDDYTRIEWLEIKRFRRWHGAAGIEVRDAEHVFIGQLLIHDFFSEDYSVVGIKGSDDSSFTAFNCIIYDGDKAGIRLNDDDAEALVDSCTVFGMDGREIFEDDGWEMGGRILILNTVINSTIFHRMILPADPAR
jgi:cytoskeletal protein CcmA (bactofilin family)